MKNQNKYHELLGEIESLRPKQLNFSYEEHRALAVEAFECGLITKSDMAFLLAIKKLF